MNQADEQVAAISSRRTRRTYPFHVAITGTECGLPQDSIINCEQIQTIAQTILSLSTTQPSLLYVSEEGLLKGSSLA